MQTIKKKMETMKSNLNKKVSNPKEEVQKLNKNSELLILVPLGLKAILSIKY